MKLHTSSVSKVGTLASIILTLCLVQVAQSQVRYDENNGLYVNLIEKDGYFHGYPAIAVGYYITNHLSVDVAANRTIFGGTDLMPGIGVSYGNMLFDSQWGIDANAYLHYGSNGLTPAISAGVFREIVLSNSINMYPGLSVFTYRFEFEHTGYTGLLLDIPVFFELSRDINLIVAPFNRFGNTKFWGSESNLGLRFVLNF